MHYLKPPTLTSFWLSMWCPRKVCYSLSMECLFLRINILRHLRRKIVWRQYPMPQQHGWKYRDDILSMRKITKYRQNIVDISTRGNKSDIFPINRLTWWKINCKFLVKNRRPLLTMIWRPRSCSCWFDSPYNAQVHQSCCQSIQHLRLNLGLI